MRLTCRWLGVAALAMAIDRATVSVGPPAANGTIIVTGFVGYCAQALVATASASSGRIRMILVDMAPPLGTSPWSKDGTAFDRAI